MPFNTIFNQNLATSEFMQFWVENLPSIWWFFHFIIFLPRSSSYFLTILCLLFVFQVFLGLLKSLEFLFFILHYTNFFPNIVLKESLDFLKLFVQPWEWFKFCRVWKFCLFTLTYLHWKIIFLVPLEYFGYPP